MSKVKWTAFNYISKKIIIGLLLVWLSGIGFKQLALNNILLANRKKMLLVMKQTLFFILYFWRTVNKRTAKKKQYVIVCVCFQRYGWQPWSVPIINVGRWFDGTVHFCGSEWQINCVDYTSNFHQKNKNASQVELLRLYFPFFPLLILILSFVSILQIVHSAKNNFFTIGSHQIIWFMVELD